MRSTGMTRKVDELGRVVLPIELRRALDVAVHDELEIFRENDCIILRKNEQVCVFCNSRQQLSKYKGRPVCWACMEELRLGTDE